MSQEQATSSTGTIVTMPTCSSGSTLVNGGMSGGWVCAEMPPEPATTADLKAMEHRMDAAFDAVYAKQVMTMHLGVVAAIFCVIAAVYTLGRIARIIDKLGNQPPDASA